MQNITELADSAGTNISELKGTTFKKAFGLLRAIKTYQNKHVDGSGNFGFVLVERKIGEGYGKDERWSDLSGAYGKDGIVARLHLGGYATGTGMDLEMTSLSGIIDQIKSGLKVLPARN